MWPEQSYSEASNFPGLIVSPQFSSSPCSAQDTQPPAAVLACFTLCAVPAMGPELCKRKQRGSNLSHPHCNTRDCYHRIQPSLAQVQNRSQNQDSVSGAWNCRNQYCWERNLFSLSPGSLQFIELSWAISPESSLLDTWACLLSVSSHACLCVFVSSLLLKPHLCWMGPAHLLILSSSTHCQSCFQI